jgi:hypothetical protein
VDELASLLDSISPEEMDRLKDVASTIAPSLMPSQGRNGDLSLPSGFTRIMQNINSKDEKTELIKALKPFLCDEKQKRADEAIRLLKLISIIPLLRELNINDLPV